VALGVQILPPKPPSPWIEVLYGLIDAARRMGLAAVGKGAERRQNANELLLRNMSGEMPVEILGTPEGQAYIENLGISRRPEIQNLLSGAREAATIRYPERQMTPGLGGQLGPATPQLSGGPDTGPVSMIPPGQRTMTLPEAQESVYRRELERKLSEREYFQAMDLKKYDAEKGIDLYYRELGKPKPLDIVNWTRETMENAKAAGLNIEGISHEGLSVAGPFKQQGRSLEEQRLYDQQWKDYQDSVQKAMSFKFTGARYLADMKTGRTSSGDIAKAIQGLGVPGSSFALYPDLEGQYYKTPQERYGGMLYQINSGIKAWNDHLTETAKQYRFRPVRFDPISDSLTGQVGNLEGWSGKPFTDLVDSLGIGGLFKKAKDAFSKFGQSGAAAQYQEGQTAANPKTGQRLRFTNGQWVPINESADLARSYAEFRAKHPSEPEDLVKLLWQRWLESRRQ
jgi:hypothetical protein